MDKVTGDEYNYWTVKKFTLGKEYVYIGKSEDIFVSL